MGGLFKIGDGTTQRSIIKPLLVNCHAFVPRIGSTTYIRTPFSLSNGSTEIIVLASVNLPNGVTITGVGARVRNTSTGIGTMPTINFYRTSTDASFLLSQFSYNTTLAPAWETITSTAMTEATADNVYAVEAILSSTAAGGSQISWVKVTYAMPSYERAI